MLKINEGGFMLYSVVGEEFFETLIFKSRFGEWGVSFEGLGVSFKRVGKGWVV